MAASNDGRIAIAGDFRGALTLNDDTRPILSSTVDDLEGFVMVVNEQGDLRWASQFAGPGGRYVSGVAFAPDGDVVVQGRGSNNFSEEQAEGTNFVARLDLAGNQHFREVFGNSKTRPGRVAVNASNESILIGELEETLAYRRSLLATEATAGYVLAVSASAELLWSRVLQEFGWDHQYPTRLAVTDKDETFLFGHGHLLNGERAVFLRRLDAKGEPDRTWPSKQYSGANQAAATALTMSHSSVVVGGAFEGRWTVEDNVLQTLNTDPDDKSTDAWLLRYTMKGEKRALRAFSSEGRLNHAVVSALTRAGSADIAVASGQSLLADGQRFDPLASYPDALFIMSFGADGLTQMVRLLSGHDLYADAAATDGSGNVWVGCNYSGSLDLGDGTALEAPDHQALVLRLSAAEVSSSVNAPDK